MVSDSQRYEVTLSFSFEPPVFEGDPDDVYELAELEKKSVADTIVSSFEDAEILDLEIVPIIPNVIGE